MARAASRPSISGMEISMKIMSGLKLCHSATASSPLAAKTRSMSMSRTIFWNTN
jgi:hypothetical protein